MNTSKDLVLKYLATSDFKKYLVKFSPELKNNFKRYDFLLKLFDKADIINQIN